MIKECQVKINADVKQLSEEEAMELRGTILKILDEYCLGKYSSVILTSYYVDDDEADSQQNGSPSKP